MVTKNKSPQRIPWEIQRTYKQISEAYVKKSFGRYAVIVFDSCPDEPSTKDQTHIKRAKTSCPVIDFNKDMLLDIKKERFLSNKESKQEFLNLLKPKLLEQVYDVHSAEEDADLLIVLTAVELAENLSTVLIGECRRRCRFAVCFNSSGTDSKSVYCFNWR